MESDIERGLAEANLLRMRKRWDEAEAACVDVLRVNPENVHAHSLLGDIFRDQGKLTEASQWYQLALDLDPNSASDRIKQRAVDRESAKSESPGSGRRLAMPGSLVPGTQKLMGVVAPVLVIRVLTAVSVVFAVLVIALLIASRSNRVVGAQNGSATYGSPLPVPKTTNAPTMTGVRPAPMPSRSVRKTDMSASASGFTEQEIALKSKLEAQADLGTDFAIGALTIDPQVHKINLLLRYLATDTPPETARLAILRACATAAQAALSLDLGTQVAGLNVQMDASHSGRFESVFGGQITRSAANAIPNGAGMESLSSAFSDTWWSPELALDSPTNSPGPEGIN